MIFKKQNLNLLHKKTIEFFVCFYATIVRCIDFSRLYENEAADLT